jgi:hypothetical protein
MSVDEVPPCRYDKCFHASPSCILYSGFFCLGCKPGEVLLAAQNAFFASLIYFFSFLLLHNLVFVLYRLVAESCCKK